jgi:shikimate kinase
MGTGKSAVGRALAKRLSMKFLDTDEMIEAKAGLKIKEIFATHGELRFRELESEVLDELLSAELADGFVLSTGGGIVIDPLNRRRLSELGVIVSLKATTESIMERVSKSGERPLLDNTEPEKTIERLMNERSSFYEEAELVVDTTDKSITEAARIIEDFIS